MVTNMSDSNQRNPDDNDDIIIEQGDLHPRHDVTDMFSVESSEETDLDDGDDDGIFAPAPEKAAKKSSAGLLTSAVALLAVAGVGGYFYVKNPDMINQIKSNLMGGEVTASPEVMAIANPPVDNGQMTPLTIETPADSTPPADAAVAPIIAPVDQATTPPADLPPLDTNSAQTQSGASGDMQPLPPLDNPPAVAQELAIQPPVPEPVIVAVEEVKPEAVIEPMPAPTDGAGTKPPAETVITEPAATAPTEAAPIVSGKLESVDLTKESGKAEIQVVDTAPSSTAVAPSPEVQPAPVAAESAAPPSNQELTDTSATTADATANDSAPKVKVEEEEKPPVEPPKTIFFDSPEGKILKSIPAPSMNASKGKGESIIIVTKPQKPEKTAKVSSGVKGTKVTGADISSTDLEPKIIAAGRALKLQRYEAAREMYDELYRLNPRDGRILMGRAVLLQKTGSPEAAVGAYEELLRIDPGNADAVVNLAGLIRRQYPAMALSKLLDLKKDYPNNAAVVAQLGVAYADSGNYEDAFYNLSRASVLDPHNPRHYYNMAVVAERAHDNNKAIINYEKALEVDAVYGSGRSISREKIYDRLTLLRGN